MGFNLKTAQPVVERTGGIIEPSETIDLATAEPVYEGELVEKPVKPTVLQTAVKTTMDMLYNMPILGAFSPRQIETANFLVGPNAERAASFKWVAMGMPKDLESIEKAESSSWADLIYKSSWSEDMRTAIGETLDAGLRSILVGANPALQPFLDKLKVPEGINKETLKNLPIELAESLTEFVTDPTALLIAWTIGAGFKKIPAALTRLRSTNPDLYNLLTKEIGGNKVKLNQAFKTLGIDPKSSETQIKKQYRKLSLEQHPDRGGDPVKFGQTTEAYKLIKITRESIYKHVGRLYKNSKLGSQRGVFIGKDLIKKYNLTPKQVSAIESGNLQGLSKQLIGELTVLGITPTKVPKETIVKPEPKERGFVSTVKGALPSIKVAGQYIPRETDALAIKAKNLIKDNLTTAQKMAATGTDDASIAVGAELLKKYAKDAEGVTDETIKDAVYEKAAELAHSMAHRLTELGRSVQAASIVARLTPEGQIRFAAKGIQKYNEQIEKTKGGALGLRKKIPELTPAQTKEIITRMNAIEKMPAGEEKGIQFKKLQDYITDLVPTPLIEKIITVWKAGLLTGIKTSGLNIFSNIAHAISETIKDFPATVIDIIASVGTGKRSVAFTIKGIFKGTKEGADKGWRFLKTGYDERNVLSKYDYKRVNMGSSKFAKGLQKYEETIFNILGTEDQPFYYGAKMRSLYEQAKVAAINKGLKGKEAQDFIDNLVMNPTEEMALYSIEDAKIAVYQNETALGNLAKKFQNLGPGAHLILPFGRTPSAVATQILNYTPVGVFKTLFKNMGKGKFDQRDFSKGMGRGAIGTAILGFGAYLYKKGMVSLDRPKTEAERRLWHLEGKKPNSIKVGGKWRTVQTFGPLGNVILIGGHFAKAYEDKGSIAGALAQGTFGGIRSFTEQTFLQSVNRFLNAIDDPKRSAGNFVSSFVSSVVPTIVKDVAVSTDPKIRVAQGLTQRLISRIPILRKVLEPRIDVFGREVERTTHFIESMVDPTRPSKIKHDPVVEEIRRLVNNDNKIKTTQLGTKFGYKSLTQQENTKLWKESGRVAYERILEFMSDENYEAIPDDIKTKRINKFITDAQNTARIAIAIEKTAKLKGEALKKVLAQMVEDKLLTQTLYRKYLSLR